MATLARSVFSIGVVALLAGCGGAQVSIGASGSARTPAQSEVRTRPAGTYNVLYSFKGYPNDGAYPEAALLDLNGTLYGTTKGGGSNPCGDAPPKGCGTVFSMSPSGAEALLYSFKAHRQRRFPSVYPNRLINVKGTLYGTALEGGYQLGSVFAISPSGKLTVLHNFTGGTDGLGPAGALLDVNGTLYGTTQNGGEKGEGTVFAITTSGKESVLYSFKGYPDGEIPSGSLINVGGVLYGTTWAGGPNHFGTVFSITTSGQETVLYSFRGPPDGEGPRGSLIDVHGTLYGTTNRGGSNRLGTVFAMSRGKERWLYSFASKPLDGAYPSGALVNLNGTLYGTTRRGGTTDHGTLFAITRSGDENVLYDFIGGRRSGAFPDAPLINVDGVLYGTTEGGGATTRGVVFSFTP